MTTNNIIYLENYVESTGSLPAELQRLLNMIRDLDERSLGLADKIRRDVDVCLEKPSQASRKVGTDHATEVADARRGIDEDQRMLVQWAEEKVALAGVTAELIELHAHQLDKDLEALETELQTNGGVSEGVLDVFPPMEEVKRRSGLSREDSRRDSDMEAQVKAALAQPASAAREVKQQKMKARDSDASEMRGLETSTRRLSSINSGMMMNLSGLPMTLSGLEQYSTDAAAAPALSQQPSLTQQPAVPEFAVPPPRMAQQVLAQQALSHQAAAVPHAVAHIPLAVPQHAAGHLQAGQLLAGPQLSHPQLQLQQQQQALLAQQQKQRDQQQRPGKGKREKDVVGPSLLGVPSTGHAQKRKAAMAAQQGIQLATAALTAPDVDMTDAEGLGLAAPLPQIAPPEGMSHAAQAPQAPGRLLTHADIGHSLTGRRAELFWPDDNLWYLIEISSVNIVEHKAQIMYTTGETEELDLDEIVREGHMSLITV